MNEGYNHTNTKESSIGRRLPTEYAVIEQFIAAMREREIEIDEPIIADGKLHRYYVVGDRRGKRNAWAKLIIDQHPAGMFGCNKRWGTQKFTWSMKGASPMTAAEREKIRQKNKIRDEQRRLEKALLQDEAAARAQHLYDVAEDLVSHPYLDVKGVPTAPRLRLGNWYRIDEETGEEILVSDCAILVPMMDPGKKIHSLQAIIPDERETSGFRKQYLKHGAKEGHYFAIGKPRDGVIMICEGLATGLSLWQCTAHLVLVAFDSGNLIHVAAKMRRLNPEYRILICADNDQWTMRPVENPGVHYGQKAALAVNGLIVWPEFLRTETKPTDFNDLHVLEGEDIVRQMIENVLSLASDGTRLVGEVTEATNTAESVKDGAGDISHRDFQHYLPQHKYLFMPTRALWPKASVNARVPPVVGSDGKKISATDWIDYHQRVEQMIWAPGEPELIRDRLIDGGGWVAKVGCTCVNIYIPPIIRSVPLNVDARPWRQHIQRIYGEQAMHIVCWLAHRVQRPGEKINHALLLGGNQGIGKDTMLEPVKYAIGHSNFVEVSPKNLTGQFNGYLKSVILRVSEAHDLGEFDRFTFYESMKTLAAAPPDVLRCNEKFLNEYAVQNVCGVILTTNNKETGIYLPADDRRHYVAWSDLSKEDFSEGYFQSLYSWFAAGGNDQVAAYLAAFDLSGFDSKAPPPKTEAFHDIVNANCAPEDAEMADLLDRLGNPPVITIDTLSSHADHALKSWLDDKKNRRLIPHRLKPSGYERVGNPNAGDRLWVVKNKRCTIYGNTKISLQRRLIAAGELASTQEKF